MNKKLIDRIRKTNSLLCVGLDPDLSLLKDYSDIWTDEHQLEGINTKVIRATREYAACYKLNLGFYLAYPNLLERTLMTLSMTPDIPVILDGKFGDIQNTATQYAKYSFEKLKVDGVTVNPYMGSDAIKPFADYKDKMVFSLGATSNPSARQLQEIIPHGHPYSTIATVAAYEASKMGDNVGVVVGKSSYARVMRHYLPKTWFLCPGVGAQGGNLEEFVKDGINEDGEGILINVGRGIMWAGDEGQIKEAAKEYVNVINSYRS